MLRFGEGRIAAAVEAAARALHLPAVREHAGRADEVGYVSLDTRSAELLFQALTERDEKGSVCVASNLSFSEWGSIIADPRLVVAEGIDRVTFNAHIIFTGTDSYRLRTSRTRATSRPPARTQAPTPRPRGGAKHVSTGGANPT